MLDRNKKKPCGWLVNDKHCARGSSCVHDHDPYRIKHHKQKMQMSPGPCWKGEMCQFLTWGCCIFYHPPSHVQRDLLYIEREGRRNELIRQNLKFLGIIDVRDMDMGEDVPVRIQDVHAISSFNKIANNQIAVPGVPPRLHPLTQQLYLELDCRNKSLGRNYPSFTHHFEPLVRSIEATDPGYDLRQTDIVTNASNLRKMFMILLNQQMEYERYDLTWTNNTLFLSKWTSDPRLNSSLGHGSGFEQATCIYDDHEDELLKISASHHRVIQYRFGGLQLVVQSEIDAYHCDCHCPPGNFDFALPEALSVVTVDEVAQHRRRSSAVSAASSGEPSSNLSVLSSGLSVASLDCHPYSTRETTPSSPPSPSPYRPDISMNDPETPFTGVLSASGNLMYSISSPILRVLRLGREIPARCLVEVKTHKVCNKPLFNAEAQLYFSQLSKLYIAKNDNGSFLPTVPSEDNKSSVVEDKTEDIGLWAEAEQNQKTLKKVVALLKKLKDLARQFEQEKGIRTITLLMRNDGTGQENGVKVTLHERMEEGGVGGCLPEDYLDALGGEGGMGDEGSKDEASTVTQETVTPERLGPR